MIEIKDLSKEFQGVPVLRGINETIRQGEKVAIIGPSGSGKSTFLRCLNLLEKPTGGQILYKGQDITAKSTDINAVRRHVGMVFQHFNLFPHLTVRQNITLAPVQLKLQTQDEADAKAETLLRRIGLWDRADTYPSRLSGGQKQRIAIVRALSMDPEVLLFDEPTSALDPELTGEVLRVIRSLKNNETTMIVVTHEMEFAKHVSDKIIFMADGVIEASGAPRQLFEEQQNPRLQAFLQTMQQP